MKSLLVNRLMIPEEVHVFIDAASGSRLEENPRDVVFLSRKDSRRCGEPGL